MTRRPRHPTAERLILRGYGPLAGLVVVLLVLTLLVPSRPMPVVTVVDPGAVRSPLEGALNAPGGPATEGDAPAPGPVTAVNGTAAPGAGGEAAGAGGPVSGGARPATGGGATAAVPGSTGPVPPTTAGGTGPAVVLADDCSGGTLQDGNTTYSPPCVRWNGTDNGGATNRGVTGDEILVTIRESSNSGSNDEDSELSEEARERGLTDTEADRVRTREALLEYFNSRYETYGRTVKLVTYRGRGSTLAEFGGGGQEEANADALKVGQEIQAFADLSATTQPYLDALVRQKVIAVGGVHLPAAYYQARAPYAWGQLVDCTTLVENAVDLIAKRFKAGEPAGRAGSASMRQKPRRFGLLMPDDPVYRSCVDEGRPRLRAAGIEIAREISYALDFSKMQQETPNMVAQLKGAGVTTVILVTDPALPYFLTGSATQQDYWPEWVITGTVATDLDIVGQFYDQDQWQFAAGQSFLGDIFQGEESESYRAYKAVRPDEPSITRDQYYFTFLMLFIGIQMAGPNLTPEAFQAGMFSYPARTGSLGQWSFSPGNYTATDDAREVYYDRHAISPFNGRPGRFVALHGGRRFRGASWPAEATVPVPPPVAP